MSGATTTSERWHEPLVLLHGAGMSPRVWHPVLAELRRHHQVVTPTLAGHRGGRPLPDGVRPSVAAIVDALCDDLDRSGVGTAHVVGNSLGGWVAIELARRGRATSVVCLSPAGGWAASWDLVRLAWGFRLGLALGPSPLVRQAVRCPIARRAVMRGVLERGDRLPRPEAEEWIDDFVGCPMIADMLADVWSHGRLDGTRPITCPLRIAWAERDRVVPYARYGRPLRTVLPTAEFVRLPRVGHVPMYDDPALVARTILEVSAPDVTVAA